MRALQDFPTTPMDKEQTRVLVRLLTMPKPPRLDQDDCCRIISNRCPIQIEPRLLAWVAYLSKGIPGRCVMWSYSIYKIGKGDLDSWITAFPDGVPDAISYNACWEDSKNGLDGAWSQL